MAKYTQTTSVSLYCPACGDGHVVKVGKQSGVQRYLCRNCSKKFSANGDGTSVHSRGDGRSRQDYSGMSYKRIAEHIEDTYDIKEPSKSTIYEWEGLHPLRR